MRGTLEAVRRELMQDGFVLRYGHDEETPTVDGLPPGEGAFFLCSFWFIDNLVLLGELDEACELFDRLLTLDNGLGLYSEDILPDTLEQSGNFPQTYSHVGLINAAFRLSRRWD